MEIKAANEILRSFRRAEAGLETVLEGHPEWSAFLRAKLDITLHFSVFMCGRGDAESHRTGRFSTLEAALTEAGTWLRTTIGFTAELKLASSDLMLVRTLQDWVKTGQYRVALRAGPEPWRRGVRSSRCSARWPIIRHSEGAPTACARPSGTRAWRARRQIDGRWCSGRIRQRD